LEVVRNVRRSLKQPYRQVVAIDKAGPEMLGDKYCDHISGWSYIIGRVLRGDVTCGAEPRDGCRGTPFTAITAAAAANIDGEAWGQAGGAPCVGTFV